MKLSIEDSGEVGTNVIYAVVTGRIPGIYSKWESAEEQVHGFPDSYHQKFSTKYQAVKFLMDGLENRARNEELPYSVRDTLLSCRRYIHDFDNLSKPII